MGRVANINIVTSAFCVFKTILKYTSSSSPYVHLQSSTRNKTCTPLLAHTSMHSTPQWQEALITKTCKGSKTELGIQRQESSYNTHCCPVTNDRSPCMGQGCTTPQPPAFALLFHSNSFQCCTVKPHQAEFTPREILSTVEHNVCTNGKFWSCLP